ncbi:MAG: hypothetical protein H7242_09445 [Microbacteriaceae bacterium]|nr:hypothetical protein [Burkholderiaceae bacterium]
MNRGEGPRLISAITSVTLLPGSYLLGRAADDRKTEAQVGSSFANISDISLGGGVRSQNLNAV